MVNYGKVIGDGLRFAVDPKRWFPFFIIDFVFMTLALVYLSANTLTLLSIGGTQVQGAAAVAPILSAIIALLGLGIVWFLLKMYVTGAVFHQAVKPKEFDKSWKVARHRYFSLLAVVVAVTVISSIAGAIPYIGWIFSIIVGLMFFFSMPAVIVEKMGFEKSLKDSYRLFKKKTLQVFLSWLIIAIISGIIFVIFTIPLFAVAWNVIFPVLLTNPGGIEIFTTLINNAWSLFPVLLVLLAGISIGTVFGYYAQAHFYKQLRGRRRLF